MRERFHAVDDRITRTQYVLETGEEPVVRFVLEYFQQSKKEELGYCAASKEDKLMDTIVAVGRTLADIESGKRNIPITEDREDTIGPALHAFLNDFSKAESINSEVIDEVDEHAGLASEVRFILNTTILEFGSQRSGVIE